MQSGIGLGFGISYQLRKKRTRQTYANLILVPESLSKSDTFSSRP